MFSTISAAPRNTSRTKGWWLRNGWTGRPLNLLIGLLAGSSIGLSLLGGFMLLRSRDTVTNHALTQFATDVDRTAARLLHQRELMKILSENQSLKPKDEQSPAASMDESHFKDSRPLRSRRRENAYKIFDRRKQRDRVAQPASKETKPA